MVVIHRIKPKVINGITYPYYISRETMHDSGDRVKKEGVWRVKCLCPVDISCCALQICHNLSIFIIREFEQSTTTVWMRLVFVPTSSLRDRWKAARYRRRPRLPRHLLPCRRRRPCRRSPRQCPKGRIERSSALALKPGRNNFGELLKVARTGLGQKVKVGPKVEILFYASWGSRST